MILWIDTETYSETPIKHGTYRYLQDCEVMLVTYAFDDGPVHLWDRTEESLMPLLLSKALTSPDYELRAWNAMFDRNALRYGMQHQNVITPSERWYDPSIQARAHSLPGGLEEVGAIMGLGEEHAKIKEGKALIQLFCKPRPKNSKVRRATRLTHPEQWAKFCEYAKQDIVAMRELSKKLPTWNYTGEELALWHLDQKINDRGFAVDMGLVDGAMRAVEKEKTRLDAEVAGATNNEVASATKRDQLLEHILANYGVSFPDMQKATLERRIDDPDLPEEVKQLLLLRLDSSSTSVKKYAALKNGVTNGRMRGTLQFAGAGRTARWSGRTFQPQNLMRPTLKNAAIELGIEMLKWDAADLMFDNVTQLIGSATRGAIIAPPGFKLVVSDLSNIEGRDAAWIAGEQWKLQAFRDFDTFILDEHGQKIKQGKDFARKGPDLYKLAYAKSFKVHHSQVDDYQRQIGKVQELALAYAGGVGAFVTFATAYGIDLAELADKARETIPPETLAEAESFADWLVDKKNHNLNGLGRDTFVVIDSLKRLWREAHPAISSYWKDLEHAIYSAMSHPGDVVPCRKVKIVRKGAWLRIILPSGRSLCYASPKWDDDGLSYMGMNQYSRKWQRIRTHGGKVFENCIAAGTPVLSSRGWLPIEQIQKSDKIWDGVAWVRHGGRIAKGSAPTNRVFGVRMTEDHLVLTTGGWVHARACAGLNRAEVRVPYSLGLPRVKREEVFLEFPLCVREDHTFTGHRSIETTKEGRANVLRLPEKENHVREKHETQHVPPSSLRSLAVNAGQMLVTFASGVEKLRGAGHICVRRVVRILREILGGHGADLPTRTDVGAREQHGRVFGGELRMAGACGASEQPQKQSAEIGNARRVSNSARNGGAVQGKTRHASVSFTEWLDDGARIEPVFDILNCGPRNRFVVRGNDGTPLVVHNCCQAIARDIMAANMPSIEDFGYAIVLTVHDEVVTEAPDNVAYNAEKLSELLAKNTVWAKDIPLAAAGYEGYRYKKG